MILYIYDILYSNMCINILYTYTVCVHVCVHAHLVVFDSATPWTVAYQAPLSMGFPR